MNKEVFLSALREKLKGMSHEDIAERLAFYGEAIDDRMEDGLTEEQAVAQLGTADAIAAQIIGDVQPSVIAGKRKLTATQIVLIAVGSPIWISLLAAGFAVVISLYAAIWSVVISLWATQVALGVGSLGCFAGTWIFFFSGNVHTGLAALSACLFCGGLSILGFYGCKALTKGAVWLTRKSVLWIVRLFVRKDGAK